MSDIRYIATLRLFWIAKLQTNSATITISDWQWAPGESILLPFLDNKHGAIYWLPEVLYNIAQYRITGTESSWLARVTYRCRYDQLAIISQSAAATHGGRSTHDSPTQHINQSTSKPSTSMAKPTLRIRCRTGLSYKVCFIIIFNLPFYCYQCLGVSTYHVIATNY